MYGELVDPPGAQRLAVFDIYEGVNEGLYQRVKVRVSHQLRHTVAWAYIMDDPASVGGRRLVSGRWRRTRHR